MSSQRNPRTRNPQSASGPHARRRRDGRGRAIAELRRSGAAGIHGKTSPDRRNTERRAIQQSQED